MTLDEIRATLSALEAHLANRVELRRVIINAHGQPTGRRVYRGSFTMPPDWRPPSLETLMSRAKGRRN